MWTKRMWKYGTQWCFIKGNKSENEQGTKTPRGISWCKRWHKVSFSLKLQHSCSLLACPNNFIEVENMEKVRRVNQLVQLFFLQPSAPFTTRVLESIMTSSHDNEFQRSKGSWVMTSIPSELLFFPHSHLCYGGMSGLNSQGLYSL